MIKNNKLPGCLEVDFSTFNDLQAACLFKNSFPIIAKACLKLSNCYLINAIAYSIVATAYLKHAKNNLIKSNAYLKLSITNYTNDIGSCNFAKTYLINYLSYLKKDGASFKKTAPGLKLHFISFELQA